MSRRINYRIVFFVFLFFTLLKLNGQDIVLDNSFLSSADLNDNAQFFEDKDSKFNFEQIKKESFNFHPQDPTHLGTSASTFWLKRNIINSGDNPQKIIFKIDNHYIQHIDIYLINTKTEQTTHKKLGAAIHANNKACSINTVYDITLQAKTKYQLYIRVQSVTPLRIPMNLYSVTSFYANKLARSVDKWVFFGIASFILLFVLLMAMLTKDSIFVYFSFLLIAIIIFQLAFDNIVPPSPKWLPADFFLHLFTGGIPVLLIFVSLFTREFFALKKEPVWLKAFFRIIIVVSAVTFVLFFVRYPIANFISSLIFPALGLFLIVSSYLFYRRGYKHIRFYFVAFLLLVIGAAFHILIIMGWLIEASYTFGQVVFKFSFLLLVFVFILALVDRYLIFQKNFTQILQEKVNGRTERLKNSLEKLQNTQQQLVQSEKMAALGTLAAGIAHEINNPLNYISGAINILENLKHDPKLDEEQKEMIMHASSISLNGVERANRIVKSLMVFTNKGVPEKVESDINDIIENTLILMNSSVEDSVSVRRKFELKRKVYVYLEKIHLVLYNVLENAIYEIQNYTETKEKELFVHTYSNNEAAIIDVYNSGKTISDSALKQVFDPFFTTKEPGKGSGLGLSIAYSYIQDHGGQISMFNQKNKVLVRIELPLIHSSIK